MPYKDLHDEPFDETTIVKLEIFEDYAQAWIPTFVMSKEPVICIFDFFAGTGYDLNHVPGSPIRLLNKIKEQIENIIQKRTKVKLFLNECQPGKREQKKFANLKASCEEFLENNQIVKATIEVNYLNEDFESLFPKLLPFIKQYPSLVYLDQNGVKFISDAYLLELEKTSRTDFLYFLASSTFWRFGKRDEISKHLQIDMEAAKKDPYRFIHRSIIDQLRDKLPPGSPLRLYPFTLKKGPNIYGLIFGASHPRAVDKFLSIAWKRNQVNGEANFDIDNDIREGQLDMFEEVKLTKIGSFQAMLKEQVMNGNLKTNADVLDFAYAEGHIPKHASDHLKEMKLKNLIKYDGVSPLVTYDNVYKEKKFINYIIL